MQKDRPAIGEYLIRKILGQGARHVFGVPGDYILNFYARLEKSPLQVINTCDEQGAGFAADAYARLHGLGVVCVTWNVGGFKVLNPVAGAYAEESPLLVIAGAPGWQEREKYPLLHHKAKEYDDQPRMFEHVTVASAVIRDPSEAYRDIDRVLAAIAYHKRPGYIELPRDMVDVVPAVDVPHTPQEIPGYDKRLLDDVAEKVAGAINASERPVIIAGVEIARYNLEGALQSIAGKANIPVVSTFLGKSAVGEKSPVFLGAYAGIVGDDAIRRYVESSDCIILMGVLLTDVNMGANTAVLDPDKRIVLSADHCSIGQKSYPVPGLLLLPEISGKELTVHDRSAAPVPVRERTPAFSPSDKKLTTAGLFLALNSFVDEKTVLIADVGDAALISLDVTIPKSGGFLCPVYYSTLGFSVPAGIGVQAARPDLRPLVLCGDGAFQMTGMEISTAGRYRMNPVVIVLNNSGFGTERPMIDGVFNDVATWRYHRIPEIIGCGKGFLIQTEKELADALKEAQASKELSLLEVILDPYDISPQLRRLCERFAKGAKHEE
ncbi:MAG TPA: thiamine pyrophosphate-binding protein [Methanoregula sp.]|nr:thiamine pyrophosphate-binding protein [Methanoregula sp.]